MKSYFRTRLTLDYFNLYPNLRFEPTLLQLESLDEVTVLDSATGSEGWQISVKFCAFDFLLDTHFHGTSTLFCAAKNVSDKTTMLAFLGCLMPTLRDDWRSPGGSPVETNPFASPSTPVEASQQHVLPNAMDTPVLEAIRVLGLSVVWALVFYFGSAVVIGFLSGFFFFVFAMAGIQPAQYSSTIGVILTLLPDLLGVAGMGLGVLGCLPGTKRNRNRSQS